MTTPSHPDVLRADRWHRMAAAAGLVRADGSVGETIFGQMTKLAADHGALNLGQGAPGTDTPEFLVSAVTEAMAQGFNQYAPGQGHPVLLDAVVEQRGRVHGQHVTRDHVLVTVGATEALTAAVLALVPPGGTVLLFEPFYDGYPAATAAAGADVVTVPLQPADDGTGFTPDWEVFDAHVAAGIDLVVVNSPHNPTGTVFSPETLLRIHAAVVSADAWLVTDEVYEYLTFDDVRHRPVATLVDDPARIVSVSSAGKTFNATGWKVGWLVAEPEVREAIQAVKQFLTFTASGPFQPAVARALTEHDAFGWENRDSLAARRDVLLAALRDLPGVEVHAPAAGYFTLVDFAALTDARAFTLNERLTREYGFTGIPVAGLCRPGSETAAYFDRTIRYSFCKGPADVDLAAERIRGLAEDLRSGLRL
ncbi:aminotransferase class I/II-fold pyridoxal phosphate-dependent enzyme [Brevibacterium litoralis]|uniref:aminotransferase class I/II-fold pyridoxal phosphate-dependent enzyme n=1 Tax=Brevibacterium litoralis TaxID=3138935 RepID=UPI0032EEA037